MSPLFALCLAHMIQNLAAKTSSQQASLTIAQGSPGRRPVSMHMSMTKLAVMGSCSVIIHAVHPWVSTVSSSSCCCPSVWLGTTGLGVEEHVPVLDLKTHALDQALLVAAQQSPVGRWGSERRELLACLGSSVSCCPPTMSVGSARAV